MGRLWQYAAPSGTGTVRFLYDGEQLVQELSTAGVVQRNYIHGTEQDDPLVWYEYTGGTVRRFLHADHQGSIVAVADDAGNALAIDKYDEWGVPSAGNTSNLRFQYTGQVWLPDLGLYYYKARIYSSRIGRFLQTDPVGYKDQVNLYGYIGNDPINGTDPSGNEWEAPTGSHIGHDVDFPSVAIPPTTLPGHFGGTASPFNIAMAGPAEDDNATRGVAGVELDPTAEIRSDRANEAETRIRQIEPHNQRLEQGSLRSWSGPGSAPSWATVNALESEADEAEARQARGQAGLRYLKSLRGQQLNQRLGQAWGRGAADAESALRWGTPAPPGVTREQLEAYRDALVATINTAGYRPVYGARAALLGRWLGR